MCVCMHIAFCKLFIGYRDGATVNKVRHHFDKVFPFPSALYPEVGKLDHTNLCISHSAMVVMIHILSMGDYVAFPPQGSVLN